MEQDVQILRRMCGGECSVENDLSIIHYDSATLRRKETLIAERIVSSPPRQVYCKHKEHNKIKS